MEGASREGRVAGAKGRAGWPGLAGREGGRASKGGVAGYLSSVATVTATRVFDLQRQKLRKPNENNYATKTKMTPSLWRQG